MFLMAWGAVLLKLDDLSKLILALALNICFFCSIFWNKDQSLDFSMATLCSSEST